MPDHVKNIIITGATDGIGLRLSHLMAQQDVNLIVTGRRPEQEVRSLLPTNAHYVVADQNDPSCTQNIMNKVIELGWSRLDHLILNAGSGQWVDPTLEQPDQVRQTLQINLATPIQLTREFAELLAASGDNGTRASVVFIGSTARNGASNLASYSASKAGLAGFARALRSEWQGKIDVQIIHPGPTQTNMHAKAGLSPGLVSKFFIDPDFAAHRMHQIIESRKPVSTISVLNGLVGRLRARIGTN